MNNLDSQKMITVIVPAYNHEKYVLECLDSIAKQTYTNFQWIVVDDCSKDRTPEILKKNQSKYGYQLILHEHNLGISETLTNTLKEYAVGKYLCICASDDFWCPDKLEKQIAFMETHLEYAMCYGRTYKVDVHSNLLGEEDCTNFRGGFIFEDIITIKFHPPVNYMIRMDILKEMGYYKSGVIAEDFYMNCLISYKYPIGYISQIISYYRLAELSTKRDPYTLYKSQEETINMFKSCKVYAKACSLHCLRCFYLLSMYKKYKILSLKYFVRYINIKKISSDEIMYIIKGIFHWFCVYR